MCTDLFELYNKTIRKNKQFPVSNYEKVKNKYEKEKRDGRKKILKMVQQIGLRLR